jgi:cytochrome b
VNVKRAGLTLLLDLGLLGGMLALWSFNLTGLALHEWLGLALCGALPAHLLVNWDWLAATTARLRASLPWRTRLVYLLNASLFGALILVLLSGVLIAEVTVPGLAALAGNRGFWRVLHTQASNVTLLLVALHLAVYAPRVVALLRQLAPTARPSRPPRPPVHPLGTRVQEG